MHSRILFSNRVVRNTGGAVGFMARFSTVFLFNTCIVEPGNKSLADFLCANLDRKRQIWSAAWCGLHCVNKQ